MSFIWPAMLLCLLLMPLLVVLYVRMLRRRQRMASSFSTLGLMQNLARQQFRIRRHVPPLIFLIGLIILTGAMARPQMVIGLPKVRGTVILAFDVSGSMAAKDIEPTRMEAAKAAARAFVERQPVTVQIGIVAFSEGGLSVQVPTNDKQAIQAAINRLAPSRGTSLATGIGIALNAIALAEAREQTNYYSNRDVTPEPTQEPTPMPEGAFAPAVVVLFTDGENTVDPDPMEAVQAAIFRGVKIHTVGIGSPEGTTLEVEGFNVHTQLDEATLKTISMMTSGTYFNARTVEDLRAIYDAVGQQMIVKPEETEVTALVAGIGVLVILIGGALSLLWFSRLP
jgi:Ca-activated chloride channel family protein